MEETEKKAKEKVAKNKGEKSTKEAKNVLVTSRVLFISVLDKIYLVLLALYFVGFTLSNCSGDISNLSYGCWGRVGNELLIILETGILYLILNWFYKCAVKTILCLTKEQIYLEKYYPLRRSETTIPLNRITGITAHKYFWIFRCVLIHRYHQFPIIFFTWNNQEFKDKLEELLTKNTEKVQNLYENKNIITSNLYRYLKYVAIGLAGFIAVVGVIRFFAYITNSAKKLAGTYSYNSEIIELEKNGSCDLSTVSNLTKCTWSYDKEDNEVIISYTYSYSGIFGTSRSSNEITLKYDKEAKTLNYRGTIYKK